MSYEEKLELVSRGGGANGVTSINDFSNQLLKWLGTIDKSTSTLINIPEGGLIPLWDLLPTQYVAKKAGFKSKCINYIKSNVSDLSKYDFELNLSDPCISEKYFLRSEERTIIYSNYLKNDWNLLDLTFTEPYGINAIMEEGFTKMDVQLNLEMKEKDKGYQYIYLFSGADNKLASVEKYELGKDAKITNYVKRSFNFNDICLDDLSDNCIYITYSSYGVFDNDWCCKNVTVIITYKK